MNIIELENISKHYKILNRKEGFLGTLKDLFSDDYRTVKAVDNISFNIAKGECAGFLGPNGAGKSTAIKMMTGVLKPTSGKILVDGRIPHKNRKENAQNIGVVFGQRSQLWWELPVIESYKLLKYVYRVSDRDYEENLSLLDELTDLKQYYSTPVRLLSLGQRMLCDIAASFLHNPKLIFLDEPTIGLDVSLKSKIRELIASINQQKKVTILLTTHDISDVEALCRKIVIIDKGTVIYNGDIEKVTQLFSNYRTLKLDISGFPEDEISSSRQKIISRFPNKECIVIKTQNGWMEIIINQDKIDFMEVLNFAVSDCSFKDIKIEDIKTESIIKKIYEGELQ